MKSILTYAREYLAANWVAIVLCLAVGFAAGAVMAAPLTVTWTNPTTNADGTALPAGQLQGTRIEYGSCAGPGTFGTKAGEFTAPAGATTASTPNLAAGTYCVRAYAKANGLESSASAVATASVAQPPPSPPGSLVVTVPVAWEVRFDWRRMAYVRAREVGSLPVGSPCFEDFRTREGLYRVEFSAVSFSKRPRSAVVVADCVKVAA